MQSGDTALHVACRALHSSVLLQLLDHVKASSSSVASYVNTRNAVGETALHIASHHLPSIIYQSNQPNQDLAQVLLQSDADVSIVTNQVSSTLCKADSGIF